MSQESLSGAEISVLAHTLVLRMLVSNERMKNPKFAAQARKAMDEFLGRYIGDPNEAPDPIYVKVRSDFMNILDTRDDIFVDKDATEIPMTWKRRLFLWLASG